MKNSVVFGLVIVFSAALGAAQTFQGTNLDPFDTPYPDPPFTFENVRVVSVEFETTAEVVDALVPDPLDTQGGTEIILLATESEVSFAIPVSFQGVDGFYYPVLYVEETLHLISGRELWGVSRIRGDIEVDWAPAGDSVTLTVDKLGDRLITIDGAFGLERAMDEPEISVEAYTLKLVPSVEEAADPEVCQMTQTHLEGTHNLVRIGTGTLSFGHIPTDPLAHIPILGLVEVATYYRDITLPHGQVVWDYLHQPGGCPYQYLKAFIFTDSFESGDTTEWSHEVP